MVKFCDNMSICSLGFIPKICKIGVTLTLTGWLSSYLCNRSQVNKFENELSASCVIKGGVPQGNRIGPIAFVTHINGLNTDENDHRSRTNDNNKDKDLTLFMDDIPLYFSCKRDVNFCNKTIEGKMVFMGSRDISETGLA